MTINICPLCSQGIPINYKNINGCVILKCPSCRLLWVPETTEVTLRNIFSPGYFHNQTGPGYQDYVADEENHRGDARDILKQLPVKPSGLSSHPTLQLLDIGCAHGFFLDEARKQGWRNAGVEINTSACAYATQNLDLNVYNGSLQEAGFKDGVFAAITILGTLQHIQDPFALLKEAHRILQPGGFLAITTIDAGNPLSIFRFIVPEHTFYFSASNLKLLLALNGFEGVKCSNYRSRFRIGNLLSRGLNFIFPMSQGVDRYLNRAPLFRISVKIFFNQMFVIARKVG